MSLHMLDGNNAAPTPPAGPRGLVAPVSLPAASALETPSVSLTPPSNTVGAVGTPTMGEDDVPGISPRKLLEELRAGQLAAERAFLERTQGHIPDARVGELSPKPLAVATPHASFLTPTAEALPLAARTALAAPPPAAASVEAAVVASVPAPGLDAEKHLIFSLAGVRYAVLLVNVIEIAELEHFTPVPNVPEWILGIINLRGDIISLVDLSALGGEPTEDIKVGSNLLITQSEAGDLTTAIVIDRVHGVIDITPKSIQRLDQISNQGLSLHSRGYVYEGTQMLSVLDLNALLRTLVLAH
jgi:purine-binding chemotaxis protein CheW